MLKLILPSLSTIDQQIRDIGASSLPTGNNFWFEDIPQIPGAVRHLFKVTTDKIGEIHELWLNDTLAKTFIPAEATTAFYLNLNPRIYEYTLKNSTDKVYGSFQISLRELVWWSWIQQMSFISGYAQRY